MARSGSPRPNPEPKRTVRFSSNWTFLSGRVLPIADRCVVGPGGRLLSTPAGLGNVIGQDLTPMRPCGFVPEVFLRSIQAAWRSRVGGVRAVGSAAAAQRSDVQPAEVPLLVIQNLSARLSPRVTTWSRATRSTKRPLQDSRLAREQGQMCASAPDGVAIVNIKWLTLFGCTQNHEMADPFLRY
jgi:hypothetical protein